MTYRHVTLMLKVLLYLVRAQRAPKTTPEARSRDELEKELNKEIETLGYRNQVL